MEIREITNSPNVQEDVQKCLGKNKKIVLNLQKQKILITENSAKGPVAIFIITPYEKLKIVLFNIFPCPKTEKPDLVEAIEEFLQKMSEKYNGDKTRIQISDIAGIIEQALHITGFSIKERGKGVIVFEKKLVKSIQKIINTDKKPIEPPKIVKNIDSKSAINTATVTVTSLESTAPQITETRDTNSETSTDKTIEIKIETNDLNDRLEKNFAKALAKNPEKFNEAVKIIAASIKENSPISAAMLIEKCDINSSLLKTFLAVICKRINRSPEEEHKKIKIIEKIVIRFSGETPKTIEIYTEKKMHTN